jgi:hypothetical protein
VPGALLLQVVAKPRDLVGVGAWRVLKPLGCWWWWCLKEKEERRKKGGLLLLFYALLQFVVRCAYLLFTGQICYLLFAAFA